MLLALAVLYGQRGEESWWRGATNAIAVGLALGAMFDLLPLALEQATAVVGMLMRYVFVDLFALQENSPLGMGGVILTQAVTPVGALLVLFLYLTGNTAPIVVNGERVGVQKAGWRGRLVIPEAGTFDWLGAALLTLGLTIQNLWMGQMRGALAEDAGAVNLFLYGVGILAALRGLALFGSFVNPIRRTLLFLGCALLIAAAVGVGIFYPDSMQTVALGVLPAFVGAMVLPLAMGRSLRVVQHDIGLNWQATLLVVAALVVERGGSWLLVRLAQG